MGGHPEEPLTREFVGAVGPTPGPAPAYRDGMPESAEQFYARLVAAAGPDRRLPSLSADAVSEWDIFPYESDSLVVRRLGPLQQVEPPRFGEDPASCWCADRRRRDEAIADAVWHDDRWLVGPERATAVLPAWLILQPIDHLDLADLDAAGAAELGVLTVAVAAAVESLPSVGRAHVNRWGDGGAHLHVHVLGRPARIGQLRGSCLPDWTEHLPPVPEQVRRANLEHVATALRTRLADAGWPRGRREPGTNDG